MLLLAEDALSAPTGQADPGPAGTTRAVSGHELAEAIRQVAAGGWVTIAPAAPAATTPTPPARPERDDSLELLLCSLSERERQDLALLGRGYANRRIAEICNLSLNTVRTHVQNVLVKLGVHSKLEAAAIAVRHGLVVQSSRSLPAVAWPLPVQGGSDMAQAVRRSAWPSSKVEQAEKTGLGMGGGAGGVARAQEQLVAG